jgi:hypothetical protein
MIRSLATFAVLVHLMVVLLHGRAHTELAVELSAWQTSFVAVVIVVTPLVAAVLLWTRHARLGFLLLIVSMSGSLVFGVYYHYIAISPDHVSHLPPGSAQGMFRKTALLLVVTEVAGLVSGLLGLRGARRDLRN